MIGEIVTLIVMVTLILTFKQMLGMLLDHLNKRQLTEHDHQERMKLLVQEHAARVAELTPIGTELEVRSVHVEIRTSDLPTALMLVAEIERRRR